MDSKRGVLIAGNWKMNHGPKGTLEFASALRSSWEKDLSPKTRAAISNGRLIAHVFPPFLSLREAQEGLKGLPVSIGGQNVHFEEKGAYTGEVSGPMLRELGIEWTLVGHSERRQYFGETDASVKKRAESHLRQGFKVILCYGETRSEREDGRTESILRTQLENGLPEAWSEALVLAYEPVWAIGTGLTATPEQAEEAHAFSRELLSQRYGEDAARKTKILYGGSVTPENLTSLLSQPNVDGGLVGGASLKPESFLSLLEEAGKAL
jgi:triosephosphate isomerase